MSGTGAPRQPRIGRVARAGLVAILVTAALALFLFGVEQQRRRNDDPTKTDQRNYLHLAERLRETHYAYAVPRNRMPLYPAFQSLVWRPGLDRAAFFERAKRANAALTVVVLAGVFAVFRRYLSWGEAALALAVAAYSVFVFRAPYVQAEVLFYGLAFGVFVLCFELARRPRWPIALAAGVVAALAHLTKASVPPAILLAGAAVATHAVLDARAALRRPTREARRRAGTTLLAGAFLLGAFLAVLAPYLYTSKRVYGRWFYNVNSTFYVWYDSWEEAMAGTRAAGDRLGFPDLPPDEVPGLRKYLREHTRAQIAERFAHGYRMHRRNVWTFYPAGRFLDLYAGFLALVGLVHLRELPALLLRDRRWIASGFAAAYFLGYGLLYCWYVPIGGGARFVLALYLPALFVLAFLTARRRLVHLSWRAAAPWLERERAARLAASALAIGLAARLGWYLARDYAGWTAWLYGGA